MPTDRLLVEPYTPAMKTEWNRMVEQSTNGTFLFHRDFMDYHADRYADLSLIFSHKGRIAALLPASVEGDTVTSHGGLTYGGLITTTHLPSALILDAYHRAAGHYASQGLRRMVVKPVPHIYHTQPTEEELYALFRLGATQTACALSMSVNLHDPLPLHQLRRRGVAKALRAGLEVREGNQYVEPFHRILSDTLLARHNTRPVHTVHEMQLLADRFTPSTALAVVLSGETVVAGTWLFITRRTVHAQYIAASDEGRACGALDLLFATLIDRYRTTHDYLDFGISTERQGHYLNTGLLAQKEGFGARGVAYTQWEVDL